MIFGKKTRPETAFNSNPESTKAGLTVSPWIAVILISLAGATMVGAYLLGFKSGHTSGRELALANSVSHVVRSPIAKSSIDTSNNNDSSDVYAKLKEPAALRQEAEINQAEVSKEVKNFLQPTPTFSPKTGTPSTKTDPAAKESFEAKELNNQVVVNAALQERKQADTAAIQRALSEAKNEEEQVLGNNINVAQESKIDEAGTNGDKAIRVIGGGDKPLPKDQKAAAPPIVAPDAKVVARNAAPIEKEDFNEIPKAKKALDANKQKQVAVVKTKPMAKPTVKIAEVSKIDAKKSAKTQSLLPGWYSQVAAPRSLTEAQNVSGKLRNSGFKARIETAEVRDEQYYRVVVGPESSRLAADQVLMKLKKQTSVKTEPFIRLIK